MIKNRKAKKKKKRMVLLLYDIMIYNKYTFNLVPF